MGILKAAAHSVGDMYQDVWREYFHCDAIPESTLMAEVHKRTSARSGNQGSDDVITNKSLIVVNEGQNVVVTSQGKIIAVYREPGEHVFSDPDRPSGLKGAMKDFGRRFSFAGDAPPVVHRVWYINTKECMGHPFQTENPIPVTIKEKRTGLTLDSPVRLSGVYSFQITDPEKFFRFAQMVGRKTYEFSYVRSQMNTEFMTALQPALAAVAGEGIRLSELPEHTEELCRALREKMSESWSGMRGISVTSVAIGSLETPDLPIFQRAEAAAILKGPYPEDVLMPDPEAAKLGVWRCECGVITMEDHCPECGRQKITWPDRA